MLNSIDLHEQHRSVFDTGTENSVETEEMPLLELLDLEEAALGHSLKAIRSTSSANYVVGVVAYVTELAYDKKMRTWPIKAHNRRIQTKKGDPMAFANLTDSTGEISITIFPEYYIRFMKLLEDKPVACRRRQAGSGRNKPTNDFWSRTSGMPKLIRK